MHLKSEPNENAFLTRHEFFGCSSLILNEITEVQTTATLLKQHQHVFVDDSNQQKNYKSPAVS